MTNTPQKAICFIISENVEETPFEMSVSNRKENDCGTVIKKAARKLLVKEYGNSSNSKQNDTEEFFDFNRQSLLDDDDTSDDSESEDENLKEKIQKRHKILQERKSALVNHLNISSITAALKKKPVKRIYKNPKPLEASRSSKRIQKNKPLSLNEKDLAKLARKKEEVPVVIKPKITSESFKMTGFSLDQCTEQKEKMFTSDPYYNYDSSSDDDCLARTNTVSFANGNDLYMKNSSTYMKTTHKPLLSRSEREYASVLSRLVVVSKKVTPSEILSMDFHSDTNKTILAAGDKDGYLGIWDVNNNVEANSNVYQFRPHASKISGLKFSNSNPNKLFMCSHDGTIRYADLWKSEIGETIFDDESYSLTGFQFLSQDNDNCIVASCNRGRVLIVDRRERYTRIRAFTTDHNKHGNLRTVSVHPKKSHYICVPNSKGCVNFFDHRWLTLKNKKCTPFVSVDAHVKTILSAQFDPHNGNNVVAASADQIKILNSTLIDQRNVFVTRSCFHRTVYSSKRSVLEWHPTKENILAVENSCSVQPKEIGIFNSNFECVHRFRSYHITGCYSAISFHPLKPIIAGTKCNGTAFVLK